MEKKGRKKGDRFIVLGITLILAALLFTVRNRWEDRAAGERARELLTIFEQASEQTAFKPKESLVWGVLELPAEERTLPVLETCTKEKLKEAPCLYTEEDGRIAIAGHNYETHFGCLSGMAVGESVCLTTEDGQKKTFQVTEIVRAEGAKQRQLYEGEWDLTLLTCTLGGKDRILVRCVLDEQRGTKEEV